MKLFSCCSGIGKEKELIIDPQHPPVAKRDKRKQALGHTAYLEKRVCSSQERIQVVSSNKLRFSAETSTRLYASPSARGAHDGSSYNSEEQTAHLRPQIGNCGNFKQTHQKAGAKKKHRKPGVADQALQGTGNSKNFRGAAQPAESELGSSEEDMSIPEDSTIEEGTVNIGYTFSASKGRTFDRFKQEELKEFMHAELYLEKEALSITPSSSASPEQRHNAAGSSGHEFMAQGLGRAPSGSEGGAAPDLALAESGKKKTNFFANRRERMSNKESGMDSRKASMKNIELNMNKHIEESIQARKLQKQ